MWDLTKFSVNTTDITTQAPVTLTCIFVHASLLQKVWCVNTNEKSIC